jgi:hypothetical protein
LLSFASLHNIDSARQLNCWAPLIQEAVYPLKITANAVTGIEENVLSKRAESSIYMQKIQQIIANATNKL